MAAASVMPLQMVYAETLEEQMNNLIGPKQIYSTFVSPAYMRTNTSEEYINPQTGELSINQADYVLPGRNGLDLEIKRLYKSGTCYAWEMKTSYSNGVWVDYLVSTLATSTFYEDRYNLGVGWRFSFPTIEVSMNSDGSSFMFLHTESGDVYRLIKSENINYTQYYTLENYKLKDIVIKEDTSFTNGSFVSRYVMIDKDGKKTYFDSDGRIQGIVDRNNNMITFNYTSINYTIDGYTKTKILITKITDTVGRVVNIEYKQDENFLLTVNADGTGSSDLQDKFQVIIYLPDNTSDTLSDNKKIIYNKSAFLSSGASRKVVRTRLQNIIGLDGSIKYWFGVEQLGPCDYAIKPGIGFTYSNGGNYTVYNAHENINLIFSHKTNKKTKYTYNTYVKRFGSTGSIQYRKIVKKEDISVSWDGTNISETVKNSQSYSYTGEPDGYPNITSFEEDFDDIYHSMTNYGSWSIENQQYKSIPIYNVSNLAIASGINFSDVTYEAEVEFKSPSSSGGYSEEGLVFRVSNPSYGYYSFNGYLAYINKWGHVYLCVYQNGTMIKEFRPQIIDVMRHHMKIVAKGNNVKLYVDNMEKPLIDITDSTFSSGNIGLLAYNNYTLFDNVKAYVSTCTHATEVTDMRGSRTKYSYDGNQQLINVEESGNDHKVITTTTYDANKMPLKTEKLIYNVVNGQAGTTPVKHIENYSYDQYGNLISYTGPLAARDSDGKPIDGKYTVTYDYYIDKYHVLKSKASKINDTTTSIVKYDVDEKGSIIRETKVHNENGIDKSIVTDFQYDYNDTNPNNDFGNMIRKTVKYIDNSENTYVTNYEYGIDADGTDQKGGYLTREYNTINVKNADGTTSEKNLEKKYVYDFSTGNLKAEIDKYDNRTNYEYDLFNRVQKVSYSNSSYTKEYIYEDLWNNNKVIKYKDLNGWWYWYKFDIYGNMTGQYISNNSSYGESRVKEYEYDSNGNKTKEIDANGHSIRFSYDSQNRLTKKSFWDKDTTEREYISLKYEVGKDANTLLLVTITDEDGYIKEYGYDKASRLQKEVVTLYYYSSTFGYDYAGNLISVKDRKDKTTSFTYDDLNRLILKKDALNNETKYTYNCLDKVLTKEEPGDKITQYSFDVLGRVSIEKVYKRGSSDYTYKKYEYDNTANKHTLKEGKVEGAKDYLSSEVQYVYDNFNRVSDEYRKIDDSRTCHIKFEYDGNGNKTSQKEFISSTEDRYTVYKYDYDSLGNLKQEEGWIQNDQQRGYFKKMYEKDYAGNLKVFKEWNGSSYNTITFEYDHRNRLKTKTEPYGTSTTKVTTYGYDKRGNMTSESLTKQGEVSERTYEYDGVGNLIRNTDALGNTTRYVYDKNGNRIKEIDPRYYSIAGETANPKIVNTAPRIEYEYDDLNRHIKTTVIDGTKITVLEYKVYDGRGNVIRKVDGERYNAASPISSIGEEYEYDVADRVVKYTSAAAVKYNIDNVQKEFTKRYTYDGSGRVLTEEDSDNNTIKYSYYLNGRVKEKLYPDLTKESYDYDLTGKVEITKTDRADNSTKYYNTIFNKPYRVEYPDNTYEEFSYTNTGKLLSFRDKKGHYISYSYDSNNNLIEEKEQYRSDSQNFYYRLLKYSYDEMNNIKDKETYEIKSCYTEQIPDVIVSAGDKVEYAYDKAGRLKTVSGPNGRETIYDYDAKGNLTFQKRKVSDGIYDIKRYEYDILNRVTKEILLVESNDIDPLHLPSNLYDADYPTKVKAITSYEYYNNSKLMKKVDPYGNSTDYEYDFDGRMTKLKDEELNETKFIYDLRGNLTKKINARLKAVDYEYDSMNRLIRLKTPAADGSTAVTRYIYDKMGNLKKEIKPKYYDAAKDTSEFVEAMTGISYTYDNMNRLVTTLSPEGNVISIQKYDANGNVIKVVDGIRYNGNIDTSPGTVYSYDFMNRVNQVTDALNNNSYIEYDVLGRIVSKKDARSKVTSYEYYPDGTLWREKFADTGVREHTYDKLGRKVTEKDQMGHMTIYTYNAFDSVNTIKDPYDKIIEHKYDLKGNLTKQKDKRDNWSLFSYYKNNKLKEKKIPLEYNSSGSILYYIESYVYDGAGNLTQKTVTGTKDPLSKRVTDYTYYDNDLLETIKDNSGAYSKNYYDKNGNLIKTETLRDVGKFDITKIEYDNLDRKVKDIRLIDETSVYNAASLPNIASIRDPEYLGKIQLITGYEYDILGNLKKVIDSRAYGYLSTDTVKRDKYTTWYTYDILNRIEKVIREHNGTDVYRQYYYDAVGNKTKERNERGYFTEYTYDDVNRLKTIKDPLGKIMRYDYDLSGNMTSQTNAKSYTVSYTYDKLNRLETVKDPYERIISKRVYDANSNVIKEIDAKGYLSGTTDDTRYGTLYTYDLANRLVKVVDPVVLEKGGPTKHTAKYEYNQYGQKIMAYDALDNVTKYEYDEAGRLKKVTDALDVDIQYSYDKAGNKLSMTNGKNKVTSYSYGDYGILLSYLDANNRPSSYKYDLALNKASVLDRKGNETLYTYDSRNLLLTRSVPKTGDSISYTYDGVGNRVKMTDATGTLDYTYDENNRLKTISKAGIEQISYTYDDIGNIDTVKDKKGFTTSYTYDRSSRMETIKYTAAGVSKTTSYVYDINGNRESVSYHGGVKEEYTYDKNNKLLTLINKRADGSIISSYGYTYDLVGRQDTKTDSYGTTLYNYDSVGRILKVTAPGKTSVYTYDNAGNRQTLNETYTSEQSSGYKDEATGNEVKYKIKNVQYVYSDANELLKAVEIMKDAAGHEVVRKTIDYKYDNNGNQTLQTVSYVKQYSPVTEDSIGIVIVGGGASGPTGEISNLIETVTNEYDGFNRLKKIETVKSNVKIISEFTYNGDDLRVRKTVKKSTSAYAAEVTNYLYDRQHVILETDGSDNVKVRYVRGIKYIARIDALNKHSYFLYNGHGDVVHTVSEEGVVENNYDYDIWGNPTLAIEEYSCAIRYAGEFYDVETGLYYLRARYYDPYTGRFVSEDSYWGEDANPLSINLYTYCHNDPVNFIDPTGHFAQIAGGLRGSFSIGLPDIVKSVSEELKAKENAKQAAEKAVESIVTIDKKPKVSGKDRIGVDSDLSQHLNDEIEKLTEEFIARNNSDETADSSNKGGNTNNTVTETNGGNSNQTTDSNPKEENIATVLLDEALQLTSTEVFNPLVLQLQKKLNELGYVDKNGKPLDEDGWFYTNTLYAVNAFKEANGLWNFGEYEGKVGQTTWDLMFSDRAKRYVKPQTVSVENTLDSAQGNNNNNNGFSGGVYYSIADGGSNYTNNYNVPSNSYHGSYQGPGYNNASADGSSTQGTGYAVIKPEDISTYGEDSIVYKALLRLQNSLDDAYSENAKKTGLSEYSVSAIKDLEAEVRRIAKKLNNKIDAPYSVGVGPLKKNLNYVEMVLYADNPEIVDDWLWTGGEANSSSIVLFNKDNSSYDASNQNAFLHAYWNGLMVQKMGLSNAKKWADAHEFGASNNTGIEKYMDLFNNAKGREIALSVMNDTSITYKTAEISHRIYNAVGEGILRRVVNGKLVPTDNSSYKPDYPIYLGP